MFRLTLIKRPGPGGELIDDEIHYDEDAVGSARQRILAKCVVTWCLRVCGEPESDIAVHCIVQALTVGLPRASRLASP